ncbi:hypothetical protein [Saccharothrix xinjiangensis]|uniref:Peptide synthetase n=1 Tax=Saccharothrix xinjiangensis TaxID=204798 RepID=A0ABV9Y321_9PSEU
MSEPTKESSAANELVKAYAANAAFRAATAEELVNADNPFRRPVRPDDLDFLDYDRELPVDQVLLLSSLLGHRMLRNIYDADAVYLPPSGDSPAWQDLPRFYSDENRLAGHRAGRVLERHLFSFLAAERPALERPSAAAVGELVLGELEERRANPGRAFPVLNSCQDRRYAATFLLLQLTAVLPAANSAVARNLVGDYDAVLPGLGSALVDAHRNWLGDATRLRDALGECDLVTGPNAYWQFYLTSSLARANHLHFVSSGHERFFEFLGAWAHKLVDDAVRAEQFRSVVADAFGVEGGVLTAAQAPEALVTPLLTTLEERFGASALRGFHAGFSDARWLADLWDRDLATQLDWADRIDEYKDKAEKLAHKIEAENIEVDLETFVESEEETSTTHVHDDHRLVVVEVGQMHFWNNAGRVIPLSVGDKVLIPAERLHGSVVLSGTCTYHQPVISEELLNSI